LADDVRKVLKAGANNIHFDVMDNHYVPNLTFGAMLLKALRKHGINTGVDVHLMVEPVDAMIEQFAEAGASSIVFHPEASKHVDRSLSLIKSYGIQAGLALNPVTPVSVCEHVVDKLDRVLIMSVNPGFGGQSFIPAMYGKIREVSQWIKHHKEGILLEVDGGVNVDNIAPIAKCGARAFVSGSTIFDAQDYQTIIDQMRDKLLVFKE
jgi:ribulose-phosphate 3-epimerase